MEAAGLRDVQVEEITETLSFSHRPGDVGLAREQQPDRRMLIADLSEKQRAQVRVELEGMVRERAGGDGVAVLTNPIHIGIGTS